MEISSYAASWHITTSDSVLLRNSLVSGLAGVYVSWILGVFMAGLHEIRLFKHSISKATSQLDNFDVGLLRAARISQQKLSFQRISKSYESHCHAIVTDLMADTSIFAIQICTGSTSYLQASVRFASVSGCCDANLGSLIWQWQGSDDAPLARQNVPKVWRTYQKEWFLE